jgi:2-dehydro-3-deoxygluconokinase
MSTDIAPVRDATAIGEGQLRLDTALGRPLQVADELSLTVAGTEGNVMGLLSRLGNRTGLVTALPDTLLGLRILDEYQRAGIDTGAIVWRPAGRVALYFVERSSPPVPSRVIYDRAESCFAQLRADDVDWGYIADARLIHLTGLTASLNEGVREVLNRAVEVARSSGRQLSVDVNYRVQLASVTQARDWFTPLLNAADVISCSRRDAAAVFDIDGTAAAVAATLSERFSAPTVLVSDGPRAAAAIAHGQSFSAEPPVTSVVDRVGAGDALIGGFLHGHLHGDPELGLRLGVAAAALALTRYGDQVITSLPELERMSESFGKDIVR